MLEARGYFSLLYHQCHQLIILEISRFVNVKGPTIRITNNRTNLPKGFCVILVARVIFFTFFPLNIYFCNQRTRFSSAKPKKMLLFMLLGP